MGWLEDDVAIVTGAGSGLGRALVDRFVAEGARVVAVDRDPDRVASVEADHGSATTGVVADVTTAEGNARAVEEAVARFGRLDVFVANAGMFDYGAGLLDTPVEAVESRGCLLMTASMSSTHAGVGGVVYTASKHAVVGLVRQLAHELAPAVRVNAVAPGFMATDIRGPRALGMEQQTPSSVPGLEQIAAAAAPLGFLPRPADYTGHYVQLASRANASATTGVVVACDGGLDVRGPGRPPGA